MGLFSRTHTPPAATVSTDDAWTDMDAAAVMIQAHARGHQVRNRRKSLPASYKEAPSAPEGTAAAAAEAPAPATSWVARQVVTVRALLKPSAGTLPTRPLAPPLPAPGPRGTLV